VISIEAQLMLLGAGIALVSAITTALVNHLLSTRADRIRRERDRLEKEDAERRKHLVKRANSSIEAALREPGVQARSADRTAWGVRETEQVDGKAAVERKQDGLARLELGLAKTRAILEQEAEEQPDEPE